MIDESVNINFKTLCSAFETQHACLMECKRKSDGKIVNLICAINVEDEEYMVVPFAEMIDLNDGNPFEMYCPPAEGGGFFEGDVYEEAPKH